jgi:lipopolysaccharide/colanic/teichoic acid biosynthesis glycosyltransferase
MRHEAVQAVVQALSLHTRATDIKGWFRSRSVLGVILTEMKSLETDVLQEKISRSLQPGLTKHQLDSLRIRFYRFPDDEGQREEAGPFHFTFYPDASGQAQSTTARKIKRIIDIIGSFAGILMLSPVFILIAMCIKLTSRGPVFFRQERVGQYEKKFIFLKFRSMYINNDQDVHREFVQNFISRKESGKGNGGNPGKKVYKITKDKRITPLGHVLRRSSLDELPQFFNVLKGEMSLVGPRPPIPYELEKYDSWHRRRLMEVKPGITGLWQVMGRSSTTFDEMVRLDLKYARTWSLWLDFIILLKTPWAVVSVRGAY